MILRLDFARHRRRSRRRRSRSTASLDGSRVAVFTIDRRHRDACRLRRAARLRARPPAASIPDYQAPADFPNLRRLASRSPTATTRGCGWRRTSRSRRRHCSSADAPSSTTASTLGVLGLLRDRRRGRVRRAASRSRARSRRTSTCTCCCAATTSPSWASSSTSASPARSRSTRRQRDAPLPGRPLASRSTSRSARPRPATARGGQCSQEPVAAALADTSRPGRRSRPTAASACGAARPRERQRRRRACTRSAALAVHQTAAPLGVDARRRSAKRRSPGPTQLALSHVHDLPASTLPTTGMPVIKEHFAPSQFFHADERQRVTQPAVRADAGRCRPPHRRVERAGIRADAVRLRRDRDSRGAETQPVDSGTGCT